MARCLEAFHCATELVLLHNRCHTFPLNDHFGGGRSVSSLQRAVKLNKVWRTCRRCPILQYTSHSNLLRDPCLFPHLMLVRHLISTLFEKQPRSASQTDAARTHTQAALTANLLSFLSFLSFFFTCFQCAKFRKRHYLHGITPSD